MSRASGAVSVQDAGQGTDILDALKAPRRDCRAREPQPQRVGRPEVTERFQVVATCHGFVLVPEVPDVVTSEVDVLPAERREVGEEVIGTSSTALARSRSGCSGDRGY